MDISGDTVNKEQRKSNLNSMFILRFHQMKLCTNVTGKFLPSIRTVRLKHNSNGRSRGKLFGIAGSATARTKPPQNYPLRNHRLCNPSQFHIRCNLYLCIFDYIERPSSNVTNEQPLQNIYSNDHKPS